MTNLKEFPEDESLVGQTFEAVCFFNRNCEKFITSGKIYKITVVPGIFEDRPLASFIGDEGKQVIASLKRFRMLKADG